MTRRCDCCPRCGNPAGINQIKDKDGKWHGICFKCHFVDPEGFDKRIEARYHWNKLPREHSLLTHDEYLAGTGQAWYQIPRRKRIAYFKANNIAYNPDKLVPLDENIRRNTASMEKPDKRREYKRKVTSGELPKPTKRKKKK